MDRPNSGVRAYDALVLHDDDQVATAIADLVEDDDARVTRPDGAIYELRLTETVPFGHKFAVVPITEGTHILKYGESIGVARVQIGAGSHVHVHNVESQRGRGDLGVQPKQNSGNTRREGENQ